MGARVKDNSLNNEWNNNINNANDSTFHSHYQDDEASGGIQLDHHRLYIRNLPPTLNENGLKTIFSKYGPLNELYLNRDSTNKYALVRYKHQSDAKAALSVLNNTHPLFLNISVAYKPKRVEHRINNVIPDNSPGVREDTSSTSSMKGVLGKPDPLPVDDMETLMPALEDLDSDVMKRDIELELERLQVQEQAVKLKKQLLQLESARKKNLSQNTNRSFLPDGRIVVRTSNDRSLDNHDSDGNVITGAGDSLTVPALQRVPTRACVACGATADLYCAQCALTPYCSAACQRRDWTERHRAVCHNLARLSNKESHPAASEISNIPLAEPLRQPRTLTRDSHRRDEDGGSSDRNQKRPLMAKNYNKHDTRQGNRNNQNQSGGNYQNKYVNGTGARRFNNKQSVDRRCRSNEQEHEENHEDWENKAASPSTASKPSTPAINPPSTATNCNNQPTENKPSPPVTDQPQVKTSSFNLKLHPSEVTPTKRLVPKNYLLEMLSVGDTVALSVDALSAECRGQKDGFVCLSLHERFQDDFQALCTSYFEACAADTEEFTPKPGDAFSYYRAEDAAWYRARCVAQGLAALLDSGKIVSWEKSKGDKLRRLAAQHAAAPEFCCVLSAQGLKVGDNVTCTLTAKTTDGFTVALEDIENKVKIGEGVITRWLPTVEYTTQAATASNAAATATPTSEIPSIPRPQLVHGSRVFLVDASEPCRTFVRPTAVESQRKYDEVLQEVVLCGRNEPPLQTPPTKGQMVIGKFEDGLHYRAKCLRTNIAKNKYMLEYVEFGNIEITQLEKLTGCPSKLDLSTVPTEASQATLKIGWTGEFSASAKEYIQQLKDDTVELVLNLPSGAASAESGSEVLLTIAKTNESVNKKVEELCTPEWKKLEMNGGDVVDCERLMYHRLEREEFPATGCVLQILDLSEFEANSLSVCVKGNPREKYVATQLRQKITDYCNSELGKEPYLPVVEELCIAKFPYDELWYRAALLQHEPGAPAAKVCFVDYGNVSDVPVHFIRKILPEFVTGEPALANCVEIEDFPTDITEEMLVRACQYLNVNEEGSGFLEVTRCTKGEEGLYRVEAKGLIEAMAGTSQH